MALAACLLVGHAAFADTLRGVVRSVNAKARQMVVADRDGDDNRFAVPSTARIVLNGKRATVADLRAGDQVVVGFHEDARGRATATSIAATRKPKGPGK
jgi:hypothetical protein